MLHLELSLESAAPAALQSSFVVIQIVQLSNLLL